eukprot:5933245-Prymnesium_polylepis.1
MYTACVSHDGAPALHRPPVRYEPVEFRPVPAPARGLAAHTRSAVTAELRSIGLHLSPSQSLLRRVSAPEGCCRGCIL